jgi:hypothetical protein
MVYHHIGPDMKKRALQLLDEGWDVGQIINALAVSSDSIRRWQDNYETYGCVNPPSVLQGHHWPLESEFTERDLHEAWFMAVTTDKAQGWFAHSGYI